MDDEELLDEWLERPIPVLGNIKPIDLVITNVGREALNECLDALRYGETA